jgi:hypothetical protein
LGNDLLKAIGIDPKSALDDVILKQQGQAINEQHRYADVSVPEVGIDSESDIDKLLRQKVDECLSNGMSERFRSKLLNLLFSVKSVWRNKIGPDPPAKVTPMRT